MVDPSAEPESGTSLSRITLCVKTSHRPRLDVFLTARLPWRSRSQLKELVEAGLVTVNGEVRKPSYRVRKDQTVTLYVPSPRMPPLAFEPGSIPVLYEDNDLVVLNKPPGILTHPTAGHQFDTLTNYLEATFGASRGTPFLCHRLDRETSGAILIAFDPVVRRLLQEQFEKHRVEKSYLAVVAGCFPEGHHTIAVPIRKGEDLPSALRGEALKESLTEARCLCRREGASLVEAVPVTGRQNQIRIHLAARGFPLLGDSRFGGPPPPPPAEHFLLHARSLRFYHPREKLPVCITAPLAQVFRETLSALGLTLPEENDATAGCSPVA